MTVKTKIEFVILVGFKPTEDLTDEVVDKIIGKTHGSSGYSFIDGERDLSYYYPTSKAFKLALSKIKRHKKKLRIINTYIAGWE